MAARFLYHASHEQFAPSALLQWVKHAESAGFHGLFSSDHFHPWSEFQGQAGFSWAWMGAALQATNLPGALICCPGYRYHPAVVAQAAATLGEMFEDRFWLGLGSGQALNEQITGQPWPVKEQRNARLRECAEVIRALWRGERVNHYGLVVAEQARLYTLPKKPPLLAGAAVTEETARWLGSWADALLTTSRPPEELKRLVAAFHEGGGEGKPMFLKLGLSWAPNPREARQQAYEQWRSALFSNHLLTELRTPAQFDAAAVHVRPEDMEKGLRIASDLRQHSEWLRADMELGFSQIILHNVGLNQEAFIDAFSSHVLQLS